MKLFGVFSKLESLDQITSDGMNRWLKSRIDDGYLANYIANRIFYPQTIPVSPEEMEIDLALLREGLGLNKDKFYNKTTNTITIPKEFEQRFVPQFKLLGAFLDGIKPSGLCKIVIKSKDAISLLACSYRPTNLGEKNVYPVTIGDASFKILANTLTLIPLKSKGSLILNFEGKKETFDSGRIGIFIDLRNI